MKLVTFLLREVESVQEDRRSVRLRRQYRQGDLARLLPIINECSKAGVVPSVSVEALCGDSDETCLQNFRLRNEGVELLLENTRKRGELTRAIAIARSVETKPALLAQEFERIMQMATASFEIVVYVEKSELARTYDKGDGVTHYVWLTPENVKASLMKDSRGLLRQLWSDQFPCLIIPTLTPKHYGFCAVSGDADDIASNDKLAFHTAKRLAVELLKDRDATSVLLALTFAPRDEESERFLKSELGLSTTQKTELPFSESQFYDFKSRPPAEVSKSIAAFANACGGVLVFGIDKNGTVVGCNKARDVDEVSNALKEIEPVVRHSLIQTRIHGNFVFGLVVFPPGREVYSLSDGKRPFRQGSATRSFRHDSQVLEARTATCSG